MKGRRISKSANFQPRKALNKSAFTFPFCKLEGSSGDDAQFRARVLWNFGMRIFIKKLQRHRSNGRKVDGAALQSLREATIRDTLARAAVAGLTGSAGSFAAAVKAAAEELDERNLARFIRDVGLDIKKNVRKPLYDHIDFTILTFWSRFDVLPGRSADPNLRTFKTYPPLSYPPLSRWTGPAARAFVAWATHTAGLSYTTYRQRVRRLRLKSERPILIARADYDVGRRELSVFASRAGLEWIATQTGKKMSHDKITPTLFNAANESGKNGLKRSTRKKRRIDRRAAGV